MKKALFAKLVVIGAVLNSGAAYAYNEAVDEIAYSVYRDLGIASIAILSVVGLLITLAAAVYGIKKVLRLLGR